MGGGGQEPAHQYTQAENNNEPPMSLVIAHTGNQSFVTCPWSDGEYAEADVQ